MSLEVAGSELKTEVMDHHGIVAASCKELDIACDRCLKNAPLWHTKKIIII